MAEQQNCTSFQVGVLWAGGSVPECSCWFTSIYSCSRIPNPINSPELAGEVRLGVGSVIFSVLGSTKLRSMHPSELFLESSEKNLLQSLFRLSRECRAEVLFVLLVLKLVTGGLVGCPTQNRPPVCPLMAMERGYGWFTDLDPLSCWGQFSRCVLGHQIVRVYRCLYAARAFGGIQCELGLGTARDAQSSSGKYLEWQVVGALLMYFLRPLNVPMLCRTSATCPLHCVAVLHTLQRNRWCYVCLCVGTVAKGSVPDSSSQPSCFCLCCSLNYMLFPPPFFYFF